MKNLRKTIFSVVLLALPFFAFGQALWSTTEMESTKHIPYNRVIKEVMKFYDLYNYYYDQTGFSKKSFIEQYDDDQKANWLINYELKEEKEVNAHRMRIDGGSAIMVFYVDKNNVHAVIFSNVKI